MSSTHGKYAVGGDDGASEVGEDMFTGPAAAAAAGVANGGAAGRGVSPRGVAAVERNATPTAGRGFGRGPIGVDQRKFRYDVNRARASAPVSFNASKADRMDASEAGDLLHRIHTMVGIAQEEEARILAFDKALWLQHTLNGASILQPGRGTLKVGDEMTVDIASVLSPLGDNARRFFRAFADDIAETNLEVLLAGDPWDHENYERAQQVRQVAIERGLQRYPHLCHDSSDACLNISLEERIAIAASKRIVLADSYDATNVAVRGDGVNTRAATQQQDKGGVNPWKVTSTGGV